MVESFFFVVDDLLAQAFDVDFALSVVLDGDGGATVGVTGLVGEEIEHLFVVDFEIRHFYSEVFVAVGADFLEYLSYRSWNDTSILEVWCSTVHGKGLSCSSLPVAHDSSVESVSY